MATVYDYIRIVLVYFSPSPAVSTTSPSTTSPLFFRTALFNGLCCFTNVRFCCLNFLGNLLGNAALCGKLFLASAHVPVVDETGVLDELGSGVRKVTCEKEVVSRLNPPR